MICAIALNAKYYSLEDLYNDIGLSKISKEFKTSKYLMLSIAQKESMFNPYAIGINEKNRQKQKNLFRYLKQINCKYKFDKENNISIYPNSSDMASKVLVVIDALQITNYAVGLTQISIKNIKKMNINRVHLLNSTEKAFKYSAKVLNQCAKTNNFHLHNSIECYYRGTNKRLYTFEYANDIIKRYIAIRKYFESEVSL